MAINIVEGPNSVTALSTADNISMATIGLTPSNCSIVYRAQGNYRSWQPGRSINGFDKLEKDVGYIVVAKENLDLTAFFAPPVPTGGGGSADAVDYGFITPNV